MRNLWIAASCALFATTVSWATEPDWVRSDQTKDGISVFKREIPGSDVLAFRGEGSVDAPLGLVASVIYDCTRGPEWIEDLKESKVLHWEGKSDFIEYDHVGTPFIMKDRDFVTRVTTQIDSAHHSVTIEYRSIDTPFAPKTSYVRGEMIHATFTLTQTGSGKDRGTHVTADIHCDPKGSVPKWIVNFFQEDWPIDTFRGLRRQVAKPDVKTDPLFSALSD